ncbi:PIAS2-like protein, partial [Mya arenaria]
MSHTSSWKPLPAGKIKWGDMQWHKDVVGTRQKSTCEQCGKSFKSLEDLAIHQSIEKGHLNSMKKPTSVEVKAAKKSCIQLSWSVSALEEKHVSKYHIQSRSSQRSNGVWSNLGMVHPQMATFHINTALLAAMCNPTTQIGIVAVNEKQQYGIRYVIQFQRTELKIKKRRINVYEYKLEGMPWKKLDWDTDNDQSIELAKYLFTKPHTDDIGTPQNLTAYMNVKHNIVVSWFPPLEKKNEKTRQLSTEESSFTGYSVYYSKVDSNVWSWIKSLGKDARCTVISHNKIPRPSEYLVGLTANIGLHMGPMVVMCFHNWQPGVLVFQNKCCKICQKSTRGKMTISRNDGRMMVSEEDKVTKGNVKFKQLDRKDVFLSANHFYQSYEELAKGDTFSDGKALHMYVFLSVALWDNLQNALDDQGRPIHRVFVRCTMEPQPRYTVCVDIARKLGIKATVRHLLKEKISQRRLEAPCKGDRCRHLQCMEVGTLIQLNETKKERLCLLCKEPYTSLCIDGLFLEILRTVPSSVTEIEFNPEGEWKPVTNTAESGPSVSIDDDAGKLTEDKQGEKVNGDECIQNEYEYESGVNSGWFFSQYGLEMDDDDIELININAGNTTSEMEAIERNRVVLMDETNGMIMIEDQNTGRSVNLHEMVPLDSNKITEECSNINDPRNQDVMNMGSNLHRVSSFSNKLSIEGPVAMDTSRDGIDVERESPCGVVMGLCDKLLSKRSHQNNRQHGNTTDTNEDNLANVPNERQSIAQGHCLSEVRRASVFDSCSATLEQYTDMTSDITGLDLNSDNSSNIEECQEQGAELVLENNFKEKKVIEIDDDDEEDDFDFFKHWGSVDL